VNVSVCIDCGDYKWGFFLRTCGLIYNFSTILLIQYAENIMQRSKNEERKLRVKKWRDEISSCDSLGAFHNTSSYLQLTEQLTNQEKAEIARNNAEGNIVTINVRATTIVSTSSEILICYQKAINRIEKESGLI